MVFTDHFRNSLILNGEEKYLEQEFKNNAISAEAFLCVWNKEIYELTNSDYFTFLLMNELIEKLAHYEQSVPTNAHPFPLEYIHMVNLTLNIGYNLQIFLEKNCLLSCNLKCHCNLSEKLGVHHIDEQQNILIYEFLDEKNKCNSKEDCFSSDILDYVIYDSLIDFFHYDLGAAVNESDPFIQKLAKLIMATILSFIKSVDQKLLTDHSDSAVDSFELIQKKESAELTELWLRSENFNDSKEWETSPTAISKVIDEYLEYTQLKTGAKNVLESFCEYCLAHTSCRDFEKFTDDYYQHFFYDYVYPSLGYRSDTYLNLTFNTFKNFFNYLRYKYDLDFNAILRLTLDIKSPYIRRCLKITKSYHAQKTITKPLNESENFEKNYKIIKIDEKQAVVEHPPYPEKLLLDVTDIPNRNNLKPGDILRCQIEPAEELWKLVYLRTVYPAESARYVLIANE
jgi:hypothetical protein